MSSSPLGQNPSSKVLSLPLFPYDFMNLYPGTTLRFNLKFYAKMEAFLRNLTPRNHPECLVAFKYEAQDSPTGFLNIGIVGEVTFEKDDFIILGKQRARIIRIKPVVRGSIRIAEFIPLKDSPEFYGLACEDKPLVLGALEATRMWLKELKSLVEEDEMKNTIENRISQIEARRRDCELAYSLPWFMLLDFDGFLPQETKARFLRIDGVVDRLQELIDFIKLEINVRNCAEALAGEPEAPREMIDAIEGN